MKKKWYAGLTSLFSNHRRKNHATTRKTSRTIRGSTPRATNRTTSRTTTHTTKRSTPHATYRTTSRTTSRTITRSRPRPINNNRIRSTQKRFTQPNSTLKSINRPSATRNIATTKKRYNLNKLKPKAAILYKEDFKCIFCFQLPKLPADEKRGIIICPHCRHPAHADEFRNWLKSSRLCSRCDRPISINFIKKIEIIPARVYLRAMKVLMKKGK